MYRLWQQANQLGCAGLCPQSRVIHSQESVNEETTSPICHHGSQWTAKAWMIALLVCSWGLQFSNRVRTEVQAESCRACLQEPDTELMIYWPAGKNNNKRIFFSLQKYVHLFVFPKWWTCPVNFFFFSECLSEKGKLNFVLILTRQMWVDFPSNIPCEQKSCFLLLIYSQAA